MKGGMRKKKAHHAPDIAYTGESSGKKRKVRKMPAAPSVVRKMRNRKGKRRASPQMHL